MSPLLALVVSAAPTVVTLSGDQLRISDTVVASLVASDDAPLEVLQLQEALRRDGGDGELRIQVEPQTPFKYLKRVLLTARGTSVSIVVGKGEPLALQQTPREEEPPRQLMIDLETTEMRVTFGGPGYSRWGVAASGDYEPTLRSVAKHLAALKKETPDHRSVRLRVTDDVLAQAIAETVGVCRSAGFDSVAVAPPGTVAASKLGAGRVLGSLEKEAIRRVIHKARASVRGCYETALKRSKDLHGRVAIRMVIGDAGAVEEAEIGESTLGDGALESCVMLAMKALRFPKPKGGSVIVTYPFVFNAGGPDGGR